MLIKKFIKFSLIQLASFFYFKKRSKVIFYHDLHDKKKYTNMSTNIDLFREHIKIIRSSGYEIVSRINKPTCQIQICFDDGFLGLYDNINVLKSLDVPINLFIVTGYLGRDNYIDKAKLVDLNKLSQLNIQSHTHNHASLNLLSHEMIRFELKKSKKILETLLDKDITSICFPRGRFNKLVIAVAEDCGYSFLYSSLPGFYFNNSKNLINRSLVQFAKKPEFTAILIGGDHFLTLWYKIKYILK